MYTHKIIQPNRVWFSIFNHKKIWYGVLTWQHARQVTFQGISCLSLSLEEMGSLSIPANLVWKWFKWYKFTLIHCTDEYVVIETVRVSSWLCILRLFLQDQQLCRRGQSKVFCFVSLLHRSVVINNYYNSQILSIPFHSKLIPIIFWYHLQ